MKKRLLLLLLLALVAVSPLQAQESTSHDNRLYVTIGESEDISRVPVTLHLENPSIGITAVEMYLTLPECAVITSSELGARSTGTHAITDGDTPRGYFVSVASEGVKNFAEISGEICTLMCDFSTLADGDYELKASGMFAVGVENDVITSYITADQTEVYTKNGDKLTGLDEVKAETGVLEIYNLQGIRLAEPQPGQVNIINGQKQLTPKK